MRDKTTQAARDMVAAMSFGEKVKYCLGYYKIHILVTAVVLVAGIMLLHTILDKQTSLMYFGVLGGEAIDSATLTEEMESRLGAGEKETITVYTGLTTKPEDTGEEYYSLLTVHIAARELDVVFADVQSVSYLGRSGALSLTEEWLTGKAAEIYGDRVAEFEYLTEGNGMDDNDVCVQAPVAVDLSGSLAMEALGLDESTPYMIVISKSDRTQEIQTFLNYLYEIETQ